MALSKLSYGIAAVGSPRELNYGESFVYGRAAAFISRPPAGTTCWTKPRSRSRRIRRCTTSWQGACKLRWGPGFWSGRLLSLTAALVIAGMIGRISTRVSGSAWTGGFSAALFLDLGFTENVPWYAFYRVGAGVWQTTSRGLQYGLNLTFTGPAALQPVESGVICGVFAGAEHDWLHK